MAPVGFSKFKPGLRICLLRVFGKVSFGAQPALKGAAVAAVNLNMWQAFFGSMSDMYQLQAGPGLEIRIDARMRPMRKTEVGQKPHMKPVPGGRPDRIR